MRVYAGSFSISPGQSLQRQLYSGGATQAELQMALDRRCSTAGRDRLVVERLEIPH